MEDFPDLARAGLHPEWIDALRPPGAATLLPLQREVLARPAFLAGREDLLVVAPTAAGKTLLAEAAALARLAEGRHVLVLEPTRALAEEKARDIAARLGRLGIRIGLTTREHRADDPAIARGEVPLVVAVYEKGLAMLAQAPAWGGRLGLVVADEAQLLGDDDRGGALDLFLAEWRSRAPAHRPRLLLLSAVLGAADAVAAWLGVELVRAGARPGTLREGVLDLATGVFRARDSASGESVRETLLPPGTGGDRDGRVAALLQLAKSYGPILCFAATRGEATALAHALAEASGFTPDDAALSALRALENDLCREHLETLVARGIGLHTADLPRAHRAIVEAAFRAGRLPVLVATPTLEQGVNLPAASVVHSGVMVSTDERARTGSLVPLSRARFLNQAGRTGRTPGSTGRALVLADGAFEAEQVWRSIITAPLEPVRSPLGRGDLVGPMAGLLARRCVSTNAELASIFSGTLAAQQGAPGVSRAAISEALARGESSGFWTRDTAEQYQLNGLGEVLARSGISPQTLARWRNDFSSSLIPHNSSLICRSAMLFLLMTADELDPFPLGVSPLDRRRNRWPCGLEDRLGDDALSDRVRGFLAAEGGSPFAWHRAARRTLLLDDWLAGEAIAELELVHQIAAGQMTRLASDAAWLAAAAAEVAGAMRLSESIVAAWEELAEELSELAEEERVDDPPSPEATADSVDGVDLVDAAAEPILLPGNNDWTTENSNPMATSDCTSAASTFPAAPETSDIPQPSSSLIPHNSSLPVRRSLGEGGSSLPLLFPAHDPGAVHFAGRAVELPPIPYRLLLLLARRAGSVVRYRDIHDIFWQGAIVEPQMIGYHRRRLEAALGVAAGSLVETRRNVGLRLRLDPDHVRIEEGVEAEAVVG